MPGQVTTAASVAALSGRRLAVAGRAADSGFLVASLDGDNVVEAELPAGLGEPTLLQHQGKAVGWGDKGWMTFGEDELLGVFPYVEHSDFSKVRQVRGTSTRITKRPVDAGLSLSVVGDTLFVLFGGESQLRGRLLDKFDLRSGAYLETDVLPHYANEAVVDGDRAFAIKAWEMFPKIVALGRRRPPAAP